MTPEEYERIKEAEKQHLQAIKKLKAKLRQVEKRGTSGSAKTSLEKAMDEIENAPGDDILDTHEEMIDRLAMDAIHQEARIELALSSEKAADLSSVSKEDTGSTPADEENEKASMVQSEEELQQIRAKELIRKMKIQMGLDNLKRKQESVPNVTEEGESEDTTEPSGAGEKHPPDALPEKTIGRIPKK